MTYDFTYLSLGAGVQSTALLILSALGLHGCPKADCAVFADTQDEPQWVYDQLERLQEWAAGVRQYPGRVKCATLPWHALRAALAHGN